MNHNEFPDDALFALSADDPATHEAHRRRQRLLNLLRGRWRWVIFLALGLGSVLAVAGYFSQETLYGSTGRIQLTQHLPDITRDASGGYTSNEFLLTEMELLKSPSLISMVLRNESWRQAAGDEADRYDVIYTGIEVNNVKRTSLIDISFVHRDPEIALVGLRAVMDSHKKAFSKKYDSQDAAQLEQLQSRRAEKQTHLRNLRAQRNRLTKDLGTENLDPIYQEKFKRVQQIESALNDVKLALLALGAADSLENSPLAKWDDEQLGAIDQVMANYQARRTALEYQADVLKQQGKGDNHYEVKQRRAELREVEDRIAQQGNLLRQGKVQPRINATASLTDNASIEQLQITEKKLNQQLEVAVADRADIGRTNQQIRILNDDITTVEQYLREVNKDIDRMSISDIGDHITVINRGSTGLPHNQMKRIKYAAVGGMFGGFMSVLIVLAWGIIDRRFRHIDDAELDLPRVLGSLPTLPDSLGDHEQGVLVAHAVHHIRTLLQIGREDTTNAFVITSPSAGSGKTSLTMALGLSFASSGSRTLLIDCDVVGGGLTRRMNASVHQRLGQLLLAKGLIDEHAIDEALKAMKISGKRIGEVLVGLGYISPSDLEDALEQQKNTTVGLIEACQGENFASCVATTDIDRLDLLPIGSALPQHAGTLSPSALKHIIASARSAYDVVLIDSGPILGSLEASMAAAEADGTILIISRGDKKAIVDKCLTHFQRIAVNMIGVVFNHALTDDITRSSYGSVPVSQSRHPNEQALDDVLDADTSARYGPLAAAVASYIIPSTQKGESGKSNGESRSN